MKRQVTVCGRRNGRSSRDGRRNGRRKNSRFYYDRCEIMESEDKQLFVDFFTHLDPKSSLF